MHTSSIHRRDLRKLIDPSERAQFSLPLCIPVDCVAHQASLSVGFSGEKYWSGLLCPPGDLPHPGIKPTSPESPALQADSLPLSYQGRHKWPKPPP